MKVEIRKNLALAENESNILEMHSILNILSVIHMNCSTIELRINKHNLLHNTKKFSLLIIDSLKYKKESIEMLAQVPKLKSIIAKDLGKISKTLSPDILGSVSPFIEAIHSTFPVLEHRINEVQLRKQTNNSWMNHSINDLYTSIEENLKAVEINSRGKYKIVDNLAAKRTNDYLFNLKIDSEDDLAIQLPPMMTDIMRDLIMNARKYTIPGGIIMAGLKNDGKQLTFAINDTGIGIPEDQIESVVDFGFRGKNVSNIRTNGCGFGLTKAYYITQKNSGKMWINSTIDEGTKITVNMPVA